MGLRINTNVDAINAHRNLASTSQALARSMQRLSSGLRINSASDDAAGLAISEKMRSQISGVQAALRNAQDGISMVQTAEGALQEFQSILHRIRDLAVQYNNGVNDASTQAALTAEVAQLSMEMDRMAQTTSFNGIGLLNGTGILATLQVGPNGGDVITISAADVASQIGLSVYSFATATPGTPLDIDAIDQAINTISAMRGQFGSVQNRLEHTVSSLGVYQENLQSAESRIRDVDFAEEMTQYTKLQILQQSGMAMLAQANSSAQTILSLLKA